MHRQRQIEWMDADGADPAELARSLGYIRKINRLLGYTRATIKHLEQFSHSWVHGETISIVDVATGSADIPQAIARWARQRGWDVRLIGIDRHSQTIRHARDLDVLRQVTVIQSDALALPFADRSVDYAITGMFLHHLEEDHAVRALAEMSRVARRGIIAADLVRSRRALFWIRLLTLLAGPMVRHDAPASVRQAFSAGEIKDLAARAGLTYASYYRHFGHRFVLSGQKADTVFHLEPAQRNCR